MAIEDNFSDDEWTRVLSAPMLVGIAVTAADPSGLVGTLQESASVARALSDARSAEAGNPLIAAVAADYATPEGRTAARDRVRAEIRGKPQAEIAGAAVAELAAIAAIVNAKAPEDGTAFKLWLEGLSQEVAEAAREDTRLGFGGVAVSEAERATLTEISRALS